MKFLVVYYSRKGENYSVDNIKEGNAEQISKVIQNFTGADIYEIIPVNDYPNCSFTCSILIFIKKISYQHLEC